MGSMGYYAKRKKLIQAAAGRAGGRPASTGKAVELELDRVLGVTAERGRGADVLAAHPADRTLAYPAGCVVVLLDPATGLQTHLRRHAAPGAALKALTCVAYARPNGKHLAAGETGHQPAVLVWDVESTHCVAALKGHKFGIVAVAFCPDGKYLVSAGTEHDGQVFLWDWRVGTPLVQQTATQPIRSLSCSNNGACFVTVGERQFKFWNFSGGAGNGKSAPSSVVSRPADLANHANRHFVAVACSARRTEERGTTTSPPAAVYGLTYDGLLCYVRANRKLEKWVDTQVSAAYAVSVSTSHVACGCANGVVRLFATHTLEYAATLPLPAAHGHHGITDKVRAMMLDGNYSSAVGKSYPDAISCAFSFDGHHLSVIYSDHSLFVWDIRDVANVVRAHSLLAHSSCVWDVVALPPYYHLLEPENNGDESEKEQPPTSACAFATCSSDGTVRLWSLEDAGTSRGKDVGPFRDMRSIYSRELVGVMYAASANATLESEQTEFTPDSEHSTCALRCLSVRSNGAELATGDRCGNVRVYDLNTYRMKALLQAHDAEVLSLDYSRESEHGKTLLVSGGRDRLIHVYDADHTSRPLETLGDHSSSVTGVRFAEHGAWTQWGSKLLSCGADKTVLFRHLNPESGAPSSRYHGEVAQRGTVYDLDVDPASKFAVSVGQDKNLNIWSISSGRQTRQHKVEGGEAIVVRVDASGTIVVCSHADRCVRVYNLQTGEVLARASGHAEVVTGVAFTADCKRLVTVSGDSCVFVWTLPSHLVKTMQAGLRAAHALQPCRREVVAPLENPGESPAVLCKSADAWAEPSMPYGADRLGALHMPEYGFSKAALPSWALAKADYNRPQSVVQGDPSQRSRWAERVGQEGYILEGADPVSAIRASGFGQRRRFTVESPESTFRRTASEDDEEDAEPPTVPDEGVDAQEACTPEKAQCIQDDDGLVLSSSVVHGSLVATALEEANGVLYIPYVCGAGPGEEDDEFMNYGSVCEAGMLADDNDGSPIETTLQHPPVGSPDGATMDKEAVDEQRGSSLLSETFHNLDKDLHDQPLTSQLRKSFSSLFRRAAARSEKSGNPALPDTTVVHVEEQVKGLKLAEQLEFKENLASLANRSLIVSDEPSPPLCASLTSSQQAGTHPLQSLHDATRVELTALEATTQTPGSPVGVVEPGPCIETEEVAMEVESSLSDLLTTVDIEVETGVISSNNVASPMRTSPNNLKTSIVGVVANPLFTSADITSADIMIVEADCSPPHQRSLLASSEAINQDSSAVPSAHMVEITSQSATNEALMAEPLSLSVSKWPPLPGRAPPPLPRGPPPGRHISTHTSAAKLLTDASSIEEPPNVASIATAENTSVPLTSPAIDPREQEAVLDNTSTASSSTAAAGIDVACCFVTPTKAITTRCDNPLSTCTPTDDPSQPACLLLSRLSLSSTEGLLGSDQASGGVREHHDGATSDDQQVCIGVESDAEIPLDLQRVRSQCTGALAQLAATAEKLLKLQEQLGIASMMAPITQAGAASASAGALSSIDDKDVRHQLRSIQADLLSTSSGLLATKADGGHQHCQQQVIEIQNLSTGVIGPQQSVGQATVAVATPDMAASAGLEVLFEPMLKEFKSKYAEELRAKLMVVLDRG